MTTHIGLICPATLGHLNPTLILGRRLSEIGYRVSLFNWIETQEIAEKKYGIRHVAYSKNKRPDGFMANCIKEASELEGLESNKYTLNIWTENIKVSSDELSILFQREKIELLIADHAFPEISSICSYINLPFISICNAMVTQANLLIPPSYCIGNYSKNPITLIKNIFKNIKYIYYATPMLRAINNKRKVWGIKPLSNAQELYSSLAVICQQTKDIEFPLTNLNKDFYYVGPFIDQSLIDKEQSIQFDNDSLIVYASLGTINTGKRWIFKLIADACESLNLNLVISVGRSLDELDLELNSEKVKVFSYINQLSFLINCDLCITHAGMNTTMHCVYTGTPMIAIPIANEQPGIASRIQYSGSGIAIDLKDLSKSSLCDAIHSVLSNTQYAETLTQYRKNCLKAGGLDKAIQIIESSIHELGLNIVRE